MLQTENIQPYKDCEKWPEDLPDLWQSGEKQAFHDASLGPAVAGVLGGVLNLGSISQAPRGQGKMPSEHSERIHCRPATPTSHRNKDRQTLTRRVISKWLSPRSLRSSIKPTSSSPVQPPTGITAVKRPTELYRELRAELTGELSYSPEGGGGLYRKREQNHLRLLAPRKAWDFKLNSQIINQTAL